MTDVAKLPLEISDIWRFGRMPRKVIYAAMTHEPDAVMFATRECSHSSALRGLARQLGYIGFAGEDRFVDAAFKGTIKVRHGFYDLERELFLHDFDYHE